MIAFYDTAKNFQRVLYWDDENRLTKTVDTTNGGSVATSYAYDTKGMRIIKDGPYGKTMYVDTGFVLSNDSVVSNHVFMGNTRIASIVKHKDEANPATYYFASDHLGSSSVLTNQWGSYHERIEYFPYGEVWVEDRADKEGYTTPYKFTGKELDKETGLYYFGARYYDARVGRWVSADPALEKYLLKRISDKEEDDNNSQEEISKSLKISSRLYLYAFTMNNPIVYIDPDGYDDFYFTIINKVGILFYRDDKGNKLWSVPANSGIDEGLNNPSMQAVPNKGPIMEGNYKVDLTNKAKPDKTVADGKGWGMFGWKLNESFMGKLVRKFSSSRGGGFYLHQDMYKGNKKGTAGCIGVIGSKNIQKIKQTLEKLSKNNSSVEVIVRYPKHNTKETK